jgi:hypothetical protein
VRRHAQRAITHTPHLPSCLPFPHSLSIQDFQPRIHLNEADFAVLTRGGALCDAAGRVGPKEFELAMRAQLRLYAQAARGKERGGERVGP